MLKFAQKRFFTLIHIVGAMVCFAIVGQAAASGASSCANESFITCALPCNRTQVRFNFDCCNQYGNYCCQRKCTLTLCSGPQGSSCIKPEQNEYYPGTLKPGQECINNYCSEP